MSTLYIDLKGTQLRSDNGVLHIETPDGVGSRRLPIKLIERVVVRADSQISSKVLCALAENGSSLLVLGGRGGQQVAQLTGPAHGDARRRWQQVLTLSQPAASAALAKSIVIAKIGRQMATLRQIEQTRHDLRKPLQSALLTLERISLLLGNTSTQPALASVRGLEGAAAAAYFQAYFCAFAPTLGATSRNRRPPRDPVNAALSLSYTLLHSQAITACCTAGLDPALGALHTLSHGRAALACDLMEPHRPRTDLWIWQLFRSEVLRPEHFGHDGAGACLLGKAGRSHFYRAWEEIRHPLGRSLLRQARLLSRWLSGQTPSDTWTHLLEEPTQIEPWNLP